MSFSQSLLNTFTNARHRTRVKRAGALDQMLLLSIFVACLTLAGIVSADGGHPGAARWSSWGEPVDAFEEIEDSIQYHDLIQSPSIRLGDGSKQISDINVLLPIQTCKDCRRAYKNVTAINGCYRWKISHPSLIDLQAFQSRSQPECANVAEVSNLQTKESKAVVWLTAKDSSSYQVLHAEIKVAKIEKLEIFSRFRQINRGDRQHLAVRAYDDEGNIFSSLSGLRFDWDATAGAKNIRRIPLKDSAHMSARGHSRLAEVDWTRGDDFILRALEVGLTELSVRILEPGYEHVKPAAIKLTIVDPFVILPADSSLDAIFHGSSIEEPIRILPNSEFQFKLAFVRRHEDENTVFEDIRLPSGQHRWGLGSSSTPLGLINKDGLFQSQASSGRAEIVVVDQRFPNNTAGAEIHIVDPDSMQVAIADVTEKFESIGRKVKADKPMSKSLQQQLNVTEWDGEWVLVEESVYLIQVQLLDKDGNSIILTKNLLFDSFVDSKYFDLEAKNAIGSELIVKVKKNGGLRAAQQTVFRAAMQSISRDGKQQMAKRDQEKLKVEQEVTITGPVKIQHPADLILLPEASAKDKKSQGELWHLVASGGSGTYVWTSEDPSIASMKELACVKSGRRGRTVLTARDHRNPNNFDQITVEVQPVQRLTWLEGRVEAEAMQESATLSVIALDAEGRKFTNCTGLDLDYEVVGGSFRMEGVLPASWDDLQRFVTEEKNLEMIKLKSRFERMANKNQIDSSMTDNASIPDQQVLVHNNFGICQQIVIRANDEGPSIVKATYDGYNYQVGGDFTEAASYRPLSIQGPDYRSFLRDIIPQEKGQEFQSLERFIPSLRKEFENKHFVVSFGSSLVWELKGGANLWNSHNEEYQTTWSVQKLANSTEDILSIELAEEVRPLHVALRIKCQNPRDLAHMGKSFEYDVRVNQAAAQSKDMPRPRSLQDTIRVSCEPPASQTLLWAHESGREDDALVTSPKSRTLNNTRAMYVLVNTNHFARLLILDRRGHASIDHHGILTDIVSSNTSLATVAPVIEGEQGSKPRYDKSEIKVLGEPGTVYIRSHSRGYDPELMKTPEINSKGGWFGRAKSTTGSSKASLFREDLHIDTPITDEIHLEVVENAEIEPAYKSIYFQGAQNPYSFHINHGSGEFAVTTNDTSIARIDHRGREVIIIPHREGGLQITVEDVLLPDSVAVSAELLISDVARVHLETQGYLMEKGSSMNMTVTALDNFGHEFDEDQYSKMKFEMQHVITFAHREGQGLQAKAIAGEPRVFTVTGLEPGYYDVTACIDKTPHGQEGALSSMNEKVSSEAHKIEVFPRVQLQPSDLLLTPNMKYTLEVLGGPSSGSPGSGLKGGQPVVQVDVADKEIATIDKFMEITAKAVGDTTLVYNITQIKDHKGTQEFINIVSHLTVKIRVRLVTSIEIPYARRRTVYAGSMLKLVTILKHEDETFAHGIAPISFDWNCSHPGILAPNPQVPQLLDETCSHCVDHHQWKNLDHQPGTQLPGQHRPNIIRNNQLNDNYARFHSSFNSSSIYSKAMSTGEAILTVKMAIEYPNQYKNKQNWFETSVIVAVQDKLAVSVPEFISEYDRQTHQYLMPRRALSRISTNRQTRLRMGSSSQSVVSSTTKYNQHQESPAPIIELVNNEAVRTLDSYGQVTLIMEEEQAAGNQVVMLNILIADIYTLAAQHLHEAVSLPLGASIKIPIKFYNEYAHLFASRVEGIQVEYERSHPGVVSAQLDEFNSTLTLEARRTGDCNIILFLSENKAVFDVIRVRVATLVHPNSPVQLHLGAKVNFELVENYRNRQLRGEEPTWRSSNPKVLDIDSQDGTAVARHEGKADIMLSWPVDRTEAPVINAASSVFVSRVAGGALGQTDLVLNADDKTDVSRVSLKLYLQGQSEELAPVTEFDGRILIRQNVDVDCVSDQPGYVEATGEVSESEGFFCNIRYVGPADHGLAPRRAGIKVMAKGNSIQPASWRGGARELPYSEAVLEFQVLLEGGVQVDRADKRNGVQLGSNSRQRSIQVTSLSDLVVDGIKDQKLKVKVARESQDHSRFNVTFIVPQTHKEAFRTDLVLKDARAGGSQVPISVSFDPKNNQVYAKSSRPAASHSDAGERQASPRERSEGKPANRPTEPSSSRSAGSSTNRQEPASLASYIVVCALVALGLALLCEALAIRPGTAISQVWATGQRYWANSAIADGHDHTRSYFSARESDHNQDHRSPSRIGYQSGSYSRFDSMKGQGDRRAGNEWLNQGYRVRERRAFDSPDAGGNAGRGGGPGRPYMRSQASVRSPNGPDSRYNRVNDTMYNR